MESKQVIAIIVLSALIGAACAAAGVSLLLISEPTDQSGLTRRVAQLEASLAGARNELAKQGSARSDSLPATARRKTPPPGATDMDTDIPAGVAEIGEPESRDAVIRRNREEAVARLQPAYKKQRYIDAGLSEEDAAWIVRSESDMALQQLRDDHMARRAHFEQLAEQGIEPNSSKTPMRAKLGDERYQRYLEANGWPTNVEIGWVMAQSPGELAGLRPGDSITQYNGQRVFNGSDLNDLTAQGTLGENVVMEVVRAGETVHITIPRGPIGISSGQRRFGR